MYRITQDQIQTLIKTLEELGNHLTIIIGFMELYYINNELEYDDILKSSMSQSKLLIRQAFSIIDEIKQQA